jgi:HK97 family phage portal protein
MEKRASIEGPLPLTSARIVEWMNGGEATSAGVNISTEGSLKLAAVWACVRVISEDLASLPMITYKRLERGKERATEHRLYGLLHDAPNPFMTAMQFRETLQAHVLLWGNAYASIDRDQDGRPVALWPLRPDRMQGPALSAAGTLLYNYTLPNGEPRALTQSDVFHLRGLSTDGITGYSPIAQHREALALSLATMTFGNKFFGNGSQPGGVLQAKTKLSREASDRMKMSWETAHQGLENAHRVAVLEEGVEWKQIGIPPEDAQFLETRLFQVQETTRIFRMPPHKVQELSRATFSNIEEQSIEYVSDTLRPWLVRWEQQVNKDLLMPSERKTFFVEHLMDALLRGNTLTRFQSYQLGLQNGVYSPNEVREYENMNPFDGGDTHLQMQNMAPYGTEPVKPEPAPAPEVQPAEDDEPAPERSIREIRRTANGYEIVERR